MKSMQTDRSKDNFTCLKIPYAENTAGIALIGMNHNLIDSRQV